MRRFFSFVAALLRIALGVAALALIYTAIRNRKAGPRGGPHGPHQA